MPYAAQADRPNLGDSTYDAFFFLLSPLSFGISPISEVPLVPTKIAQFLQISISFLAARLKPKTFDELIDAFLIAILGSSHFLNSTLPNFAFWWHLSPVFLPRGTLGG
jgi:hypothetical protein